VLTPAVFELQFRDILFYAFATLASVKIQIKIFWLYNPYFLTANMSIPESTVKQKLQQILQRLSSTSCHLLYFLQLIMIRCSTFILLVLRCVLGGVVVGSKVISPLPLPVPLDGTSLGIIPVALVIPVKSQVTCTSQVNNITTLTFRSITLRSITFRSITLRSSTLSDCHHFTG